MGTSDIKGVASVYEGISCGQNKVDSGRYSHYLTGGISQNGKGTRPPSKINHGANLQYSQNRVILALITQQRK